MKPASSQITSTLLLISPFDFSFNSQTALDNEFQNNKNEAFSKINSQALDEFNRSVEILRKKGINILVFDKKGIPELANDITPDSVFPNNWLSTDSEGRIFIYPMCAPNRRLETNALPFIKKLFAESGYKFEENVIEIKGEEQQFLEGTGSLIFDRPSRRFFASLSQRTHPSLLNSFAQTHSFTPISFPSLSSTGKPFYHTNILLCLGEGFAVVCLEAIVNTDTTKLKTLLEEGGREVIEISLEQAEKYFCGNMLHVKNDMGEKFIVMSERAKEGLGEEKRLKIQKYGEIVALPLGVIEEVGGGSARCMLCEVFLNKK